MPTLITKQQVEEELQSIYGNYLSRKQVAEELGVKPITIRRAEKAKKLTPVRLSQTCIRYPVASVAAYIIECMEF